MGRAAVFLDRDGTLVDELGFLADPERLRLLPDAAAGVRLLNEAGLAVVVVTNQSGLARGLFGPPELEAVHGRLEQELARGGARLDGILACPHHPTEGAPPLRARCSCRKPEPGLLVEAARRFGLELADSWMVGDDARDLEAGRRAGVRASVLVLTGKGRETLQGMDENERSAIRVAGDLLAAARLVLQESGKGIQGS